MFVRHHPIVPLLVGLAAVITLVILPREQPRPVARRQEREARVRVGRPGGGAPRVAMAGFAAAGGGPGVARIATEVGDVFRADLDFEGVFELLPAIAPSAPAQDTSVDGLVAGRLSVENGEIHLEVRVSDARSGQLAFGREYVGPLSSPRLIAHVAANEVMADVAGVQGLAHTRFAFVSDRSGSFNEPTGSRRRVKEIFVSDYDGAADARVTTDGDLDLTPSWSPDRGAVAYTSYRRGYQDVFVTRLADRRQESPTRGRGKNWLPAWSPDGVRIAFTTNRDGNEEIYVMNADGSGQTRLTTHWAIDTSPAWSPTGARIAFTSNRGGSPQIWVMNADGSDQRQLTTEKYCDRPSWSPGPIDEIAYVSRTKTGFDIKVIDPATGVARQLTFGPQNESPTFSPNGRHIAFTSTRGGTQQIWTMTREGKGVRQVTRVGNNSMPAWSR